VKNRKRASKRRSGLILPRNPLFSCALTAETKEVPTATNEPVGDGHRIGAVKKRSQLKTKMMGEAHYTKRDKTSGEFMAQKKDDKKFKGVRKEKPH